MLWYIVVRIDYSSILWNIFMKPTFFSNIIESKLSIEIGTKHSLVNSCDYSFLTPNFGCIVILNYVLYCHSPASYSDNSDKSFHIK